MHPIRRILVAVKDPTAKSLAAVAKGAQLARAFGAELELFHAIDTPINVVGIRANGIKELKSAWRKQYLQQLDRIAARIRGHGVKVATVVEWDYPVYESIVRRASRIGANLIVAARHPSRHVAPWLLHMTDWELLRLSTIPVLIVKSPRPYHRPVVLAAVDPTHAFAKPAQLDQEILRLGSALTDALRGTLHAVHAHLPMLVGMPQPEAWTTGDIIAEIEAKSAAQAKVGFERVLRSINIPRSRRHLIARNPIDAIPDVARRTRSAIVVMGAISRSGLKRVFIGNTAERVLDELACDLLIVKPSRFVSRVPRAARGIRLAAVAPLP